MNLGTGNRYYSDQYTCDVVAGKLLWDEQIENADRFDLEPCVIDQLGASHRGAFTFQ